MTQSRVPLARRFLGAWLVVVLFVCGCAPALDRLLGGGIAGGGAPAGPTQPFSGSLIGVLPGAGAPPAQPPGPPPAPDKTLAGSPIGVQVAQAASSLPIPFPYDSATKGGTLGCAQVVTTALANAGAIRKGEVQLAVKGAISLLQGKGWRSVRPPPYADGDVITWSPPPGSPHMHIGIIKVENGTPYAIHNSSSQKRPVKVPLASMNRVVDRILRNPVGVAS
jgi:hypothetical protein